ncbi:mannonate dehydratase [Haloferula luteola]|uniref:Mannonate dehydratase n=1 Tax=Haloferula luteola TaxID=595692 RepID=A0A840V3U8_9BACT|nr:mannonate dehydratase [Haloferula luteola]MBB5352203.1 mannonate dehydratase [Haloferula luteola]
MLAPSMRWFGPSDPVSPAFIRQAGATSVFTALHEIPYGAPWPLADIQERKQSLATAGLSWKVVESVPVHEDIKTGKGDLTTRFDHYATTLRHLASEGIETVIYNFMPVLDWVRTDMHFLMPDGSRSMRYDPVQFAAFDLFALRRHGAEDDHSPEIQEQAAAWWQRLDSPTQQSFIRSIIDVFPGVKWNLRLDDIHAMLSRYQGIGEPELRQHLGRFLDAIVPVAESCGIRLAIHPDDPPFPILGLPRIVSTGSQLEDLLALAPSPSHGLCFCTGSLGARSDNALPELAGRFADRIHALHLRSTSLESQGAFHEAPHLEGSTSLAEVLISFLRHRRRPEEVPFRPDHGLVIMDDLAKPEGITPGYSALGRMKGLAEIRGLILGLELGAHL